MPSKYAPPLLIALVLLGGCQQYNYRYRPYSGQTFYDPVSADYHLHGQTVDILVDARGRRLEHIDIQKPNGSVVPATGVDYPPFVSPPIGGTTVPIEGPERADGPTIAHFDKNAMGPKPWKVHVKIRGLPPLVFNMG